MCVCVSHQKLTASSTNSIFCFSFSSESLSSGVADGGNCVRDNDAGVCDFRSFVDSTYYRTGMRHNTSIAKGKLTVAESTPLLSPVSLAEGGGVALTTSAVLSEVDSAISL